MPRYDFDWDRRAHIRLSSRALPRTQSLFFDMDVWTPPTANMEGQACYYPAERVHAVRTRLKGLDRKAYLRDILDHLLPDKKTDKERVAAICRFVGDAIYYNPIQQPTEPTKPDGSPGRAGIHDPIELLEYHDGRCGQGVTVTLALLEAAGIEARSVALDHHVSCEARYDGGWHLADALMFGEVQPHRDGVVLSGDQVRAEPYFTDQFEMPYLYGTIEEYLSEDGFRLLGYAFGEWGSSLMPYHSWYWGAPLDCPPTLPFALVTQRLGEQRVRLNWAPSFKHGGGPLEYRVDIFSDRACTKRVHQAFTKENHLDWDVPAKNVMYYIETRAMDDHRKFNPNTWYPPARNNFVLVPAEQYGWYGVV